MGRISIFFFIFSLGQIGYADDLQFTCRGQSLEYGHIAVSIETGIVGRATIRNCRLAKELAIHIGAPEKEFDSFVFAAFLGSKCEADTSAGSVLKCTFTPAFGEEDLHDEVGVEVELGATNGHVVLASKTEGTSEVQVLLKRAEKDFSRTVSLPSLTCEHGLTIAADEGTCH